MLMLTRFRKIINEELGAVHAVFFTPWIVFRNVNRAVKIGPFHGVGCSVILVSRIVRFEVIKNKFCSVFDSIET